MQNHKIKIQFGELFATINQHGAGLMELWRETNTGQENYLFGYSNKEEQIGCQGDVLFPWAGRVENSRYEFEGKTHELKPELIISGNALHGFAKDQDFEIIDQTENSVRLKYSFSKDRFEAKGYPFSAGLEISYSLDNNGLTCKTKVVNTGQNNLPFGLGFHPYLKLSGFTIENLLLEIPALKLVKFDSSLKPTGEFIDVKTTELDFSSLKKIDKTVIDNCFYDLTYKDGVAKTILKSDEGQEICFWQDRSFPYLQIYSADTIGEENFRKGLAIEAQTCCGYAFNMPQMGLKILKPKEVFEGSWGIKIESY